jgi:hypothetical protein
VYAVQSGKTRKVFSIDARMPWSIYLNRILSWRVVVGLDAPARRADMDLLLRRAADRLVARLRRVA